jgi:ATP-dependent helicase/DNAse subunit B
MAIVIDYKSGKKKPDEDLSWNGIQLQLPVYMNVLKQPNIEASLKQNKSILLEHSSPLCAQNKMAKARERKP